MSSQRRRPIPAWAALIAATLSGACEDPTEPERASPAALAAVGAAAVPGLGLRSASSGQSSENKSAVVACPDGQSVLGIGGRIRGGDGRVTMDALVPKGSLPGGSDATVRASEIGGGTSAEWSVVVYAICAGVPTIERGRIGPPSSASPRTTATGADSNPCSTQGQILTGTGGEVANGPFGEILLTALIPSADLEGVTVRAAEDPPGTDADWRLDAAAICADLPGVQRVVATSPSTSANKHATAVCPGGTRVVGTGGEIVGGARHVVMTYIVPDAGLTRVHVRGAEDAVGTTAPWAVRAYAVCAAT